MTRKGEKLKKRTLNGGRKSLALSSSWISSTAFAENMILP